MALLSGDRLGVYKVVGPIGQGGMGEVFRARDTKLERDVAIKVLPDLFAADPERLARFTREAQVLAALNHPNIAHVYGVEESSHVRALVMELVPGPTLAQLIGGADGARGPQTRGMPLASALTIARQIALALEAAHEKGIVHRDLKPANIKLADDDTVKVLDFGLAKALSNEAGAGSDDAANSPTITSPALSRAGLILGTAQYMAPEQARGKVVDKRADIWAFGCVLFEMLTGWPAFEGETVTDILGAIVHKEPDWASVPDSVPAPITQLLRRCLQKDPKLRLRDIGDARLALDEAAAAPVSNPTAGRAAAGTRRPSISFIAFSLFTGLAGLVAGWMLPRAALLGGGAPTHFAVMAPTGAGTIGGVAIAPDGGAVVYQADRLYLQRFDQFASQAIGGTDNAANLFMSPDGKWAGFYQGGKIKKVSLAGGDPLTICDADNDTPGARWGPGNTVLFAPGWNTPLYSVSADGGKPEPITTVKTSDGELGHWDPEILPGGKTALFTIWMAGTGINDSRIGILDLTTRQHRVLMPGANPRYLSSGHLLYFHAGSYHLVPFDAAALRTTGDATLALPDARGVHPSGGGSSGLLSVSRGGTVAYVPGAVIPLSRFAWVSRSGIEQDLGFAPRAIASAELSPDGRRIAASRVEGGAFELWLYDTVRRTEDHLAAPGSSHNPTWTADSASLAFYSMRKGNFDVFTMRLDDRTPRPLIEEPYDQSPVGWTADGKRLLVMDWDANGKWSVSLADVAQPAKREKLALPPNSDYIALSTDNHWLLFDSARSGRREVYVQPFPGPGIAVPVSTGGGDSPFWSRAGHDIFYHHEGEIRAAGYRDDAGRFVVTGETLVFRGADFKLRGVAPDGRLLITRYAHDEEVAQHQFRVILNWSK